jgi:hypothetical protein
LLSLSAELTRQVQQFSRRILWILVALAPLLHCPSASSAPVDGPRRTVEQFVDFYLNAYKKGFPGTDERKALRPLVTERFMAVLEDAARGMECHYKATGGKEPPPSEGDIFVSLFEGATGVDGIAELQASKDQATYAVSWVFKDPLPGREREPPFTWKDNILLKNIDGRWQIDDFTHEGTWEFMTRGSVSSILKRIASQCGK